MELTTKEKEQESISGRTYIKDGVIIWTTDQSDIIEQIPIKDIKIIGEFTTSKGPIQDDWFFVFILSKNDIRQISAYATGTEEMLKQVGQQINADIYGQLASSADWKTNTLWPTGFRGQELFKTTEKQPTNIWEKLKSKIGLTETEIELTEDLTKYLG
jgi:hypothetical protein